MNDPSKAVDWLDQEAARWVWEHIPPHLARIDRLTLEAVAHMNLLPVLPTGALWEWASRLTQLLQEIHSETVIVETMYRCIGEWSGWKSDDGIQNKEG